MIATLYLKRTFRNLTFIYRLQEQQQLQKLRPNIVITNIPYTVTKQIIPSPLTPNSTEFLLDSELASVDENQEVIKSLHASGNLF